MNNDVRIMDEAVFHDKWAASIDVKTIDVKQINESITSPELRYINKRLGDLKDLNLLDVGCGLGEASVYFAMRGAKVTACDISDGMLNTATKLAKANKVKISTTKSGEHGAPLGKSKCYDIIYAGNVLHHINLRMGVESLIENLKSDGVLVTWDPIAYNPIINIYRHIATSVRTPDERPLTYSDIQFLKKRFEDVEIKFFWLFTLLIFVIMFVIQCRNPNKERFWKSVVYEEEKWAWLYKPLKILDELFLTLFPPLQLLCWNVVIIAKKPKTAK